MELQGCTMSILQGKHLFSKLSLMSFPPSPTNSLYPGTEKSICQEEPRGKLVPSSGKNRVDSAGLGASSASNLKLHALGLMQVTTHIGPAQMSGSQILAALPGRWEGQGGKSSQGTWTVIICPGSQPVHAEAHGLCLSG